MSLDKAISSGKEWRRPYKAAKLYFRSCRNHGRCSYCKDSRMYSSNKNLIKYDQMEKEFVKDLSTNQIFVFGYSNLKRFGEGPIPIKEIEKLALDFINFAKRCPELEFMVREDSCGLDDYKVEDIAPLFLDAINVPNITLPKSFLEFLTR